MTEAPSPLVHISLHACQGPEGYLWHGLGRYTRDLTVPLLRHHRQLIGGLHMDPHLPVPRTLGDFSGYGLLEENSAERSTPAGQDGRPLIYHVTSPFWPPIPAHRLIPSHLRRAGARLIVTLFDLIPLVFPEQYLSDRWFQRWYPERLQLLHEADHIIAISKHARDDGVRLLGLNPERITVTYLGGSPFFRRSHEPLAAIREKVRGRLPEIRGRFMVYPFGTANFRKNLAGAIDALASLPLDLRESIQLVGVGSIGDRERQMFHERAQANGVSGALLLPGFIPDELLRELYQTCDLCVYPSRYEGFGLPILEAMRCGAPVVTSDATSTKELIEIPEARFDPEDASDIAQVITRALTDPSLRRTLIDYGLRRSRELTWERTAQATADCYREVAAARASRSTAGRPIAPPPVAEPALPPPTPHHGHNGNGRLPRVYLGLQALQGPLSTRRRGFPRFVEDHVLALMRHCPELIAGLVLNDDLETPKDIALFAGSDLLKYYPPVDSRDLPGEGIGGAYHILSPSFPDGPMSSVLPPPFNRNGTKLFVTLHDLIQLVFPQMYLPTLAQETTHRRRLRLVQEADHVLAVSQTTRDDAIKLLGIRPEQMTVVSEGVSDFFRPPGGSVEAVRQQLREGTDVIEGPYILSMLYAHEFGKRKNLERAIEAYARLPQYLRNRLQFVLIGEGTATDRAGTGAHAEKHGVAHRLVFAGTVSDELLRALYQGCDLFIMPSLYEGFGLPVIEAMRSGAPVIVSDRPALNEVVEMADARFNPEDVTDIARVMERALTDTDFNRHLRDYGHKRSRDYTWEHTAKVTADCYREMTTVAPRGNGARNSTKHLALCTPLIARDDTAEYVLRLLRALTSRCPVNVDLVVPGDPNSYHAWDNKMINLVSGRQFQWLAERGHYDDVIYSMGNGLHYEHSYKLLKQHRGIVWLHEIRLTEFYRSYYEQLGHATATLPPELQHWARRYPQYQDRLLERSVLDQHEQGIYLSGEVAAHARKLVVNSRFSRELLEIDSGTTAPVVAIPYGAPEINIGDGREGWTQLAGTRGLQPSACVIVCSGSISPLNCLETVVDAFSDVASDHPDAVLALIGRSEADYQRQIEQRAAHLGVQDRLIFTGFVDDDNLNTWLAAACCAVRLRFPTSGESSMTVMRYLASGVPTIVNDHGAFRDLPDDAVVKVSAQPEPSELSQALSSLVGDGEARGQLRESAMRYARDVSLEAAADQFYMEVLL